DGHIRTKQPLEHHAEGITPVSRPFRHVHAELQAKRKRNAVPKPPACLSVKLRRTDFEWMRRTLTIGTILWPPQSMRRTLQNSPWEPPSSRTEITSTRWKCPVSA